MVKTIHEVFDDNVFDKLVEAKGILTWKEFILTLIPKKEEKDETRTIER